MAYRVLIADSNVEERTLCARLLEMSGFDLHVREVQNSLDYLGIVGERSVDIAIIGLQPGFCSAPELLRALFANSIPVILLVAEHELELADNLDQHAIHRRITKNPSGYLSLPQTVIDVFEGETDTLTGGGIPEAVVHALGGLVFVMNTSGTLIRVSGPLSTNMYAASLQSALLTRLQSESVNQWLPSEGQPHRWDNVTLQDSEGRAIQGQIVLTRSLDEHGQRILVGIFLPSETGTSRNTRSSMTPGRLHQITHDLKAPLRGVARTLDILRAPGSSLSAEDRTLLDGAHAGVIDAIDALRSALRPRQQTAPTIQNTAGLTDASKIMLEIQELLTPDIEEKAATLRIGKLPELPVEAQDLRIILTNLVDNALKYSTAPAPIITVQATRRGSAWLFSVHDNGPGIPSREVEQIFEMHCRGSNARGQGNGVGLALCRAAVERYGGSIWVTTGAGSTFQFTLPDIGLVSDRVGSGAA
ncbi:MAG: ATP-binding protein [Myxococcota bacterium]|nr:ATP-binding protein [Myxococcota bacterium]